MSTSIGGGFTSSLPFRSVPTVEQPGDPPATIARIAAERRAASPSSLTFDLSLRRGTRVFRRMGVEERPSLVVQSIGMTSDEANDKVAGLVSTTDDAYFADIGSVLVNPKSNRFYAQRGLPMGRPIDWLGTRDQSGQEWSSQDAGNL